MDPNKTVDLNYRRVVRDSKRIDTSQHARQIRMALLKDFKIKLSTGQVRGLKNVGDFIALIAKKAQ